MFASPCLANMLEHARAHTSNLLCRDDDELRTGLRGHITALMPQEVILPRRGLTSTTSKVLRASLRNPRQHQLTPGDRFWDAERTMEEITKAAYFKPSGAEQAGVPEALQVSSFTALCCNDTHLHWCSLWPSRFGCLLKCHAQGAADAGLACLICVACMLAWSTLDCCS